MPVRAGPDPTLSVPDFSVPCRAGKRTDPILDFSGPSGHIPDIFFDFGVKYVFDSLATCVWTFHKNPIFSSSHSHKYWPYMGV